MSAPALLPTAGEFFAAMANMRSAALSLVSKREKITEAAGGVAGVLDTQKERLVCAPHLPAWNGKPLKKELQKAFDVAPVALENDTALAGLGEAVYGAGKGRRIVAYVTVSTGVGGSRIVNKKIDENAMGFEPGHQIIDVRAKNGGSLEELISGTALAACFGKKPEKISDQEVWREAADMLAVGLHNTIVHWSPDIVVLGGAVMRNKIPFDATVRSLAKRMKIFSVLPQVRLAALGDFGGLWGALAILKRKK